MSFLFSEPREFLQRISPSLPPGQATHTHTHTLSLSPIVMEEARKEAGEDAERADGEEVHVHHVACTV